MKTTITKKNKTIKISLIIAGIVIFLLGITGFTKVVGNLDKSAVKIEKELETKYNKELNFKESRFSISGNEYIYTVKEEPELEISAKYALKVNLNPLGEYLFDIGPKIVIEDDYKEKAIDYLEKKYLGNDKIIGVSGMNKFQALEEIKSRFLSIKRELEEEYSIYLPDNFYIEISYNNEKSKVDLERLTLSRTLMILLENLGLPAN